MKADEVARHQFDSIVARATEEVAAAYGSAGSLRERLVAGLGRFMELVVERPEVATFATVDSLTLGSGSSPIAKGPGSPSSR